MRRLLDRESLEIGNALLEGIIFLLGGDVFLHVLDDPIDHVFLFHAAENIGHLKLVVETTADLK